jgi:serine/threonine-protein kinase
MNDKNEIEFQALALFEASLEINEKDRKAWIEHKAANNAEVLKKALALLAKDESRSKRMLTGMVFTDTQAPQNHPERVGGYKITAFIGQGGMGAVYKGERDQGDFDLSVAIKLIRPSALSSKLIERFGQEQQTLAKLIHPNIARLYDGGKTEDGAPYLIMEYVDGAPLTSWISQNSLNQAQILKLFLTVCSAVRYAHQNLIIHRDITPSNIMVTKNGDVKLIDFGIAKPLEDTSDPAVQASTASTASSPSLSSLSFTPGFAAPERKLNANNSSHSQYSLSSTLLDVYSLGKLLEALLQDIQPSKGLAPTPLAQTSPELYSIIQKASAKLPENRYATVNGLIDDVNNYTLNLPISAYSTLASYRFKKFTQRHKKGVFVFTITTLSLVLALVVSVTQYYRAERNLEEANNRFNQVRDLSTYQIFELFDKLSRVAGTTSVRANLANKAQTYLAILSQQPQASLAVKLETIKGYLRLAYVYGVPAQPNLGMQEEAYANLETAEKLLALLEVEQPNSPAVITTRAGILAARAMGYNHDNGDINKAKEAIDAASELLQMVPTQHHNVYWHKTRRSLRYSQLEWADQASDSAQIRTYAKAFINDIEEWPAALQNSFLKAQDENYYYYWLALAHYIDDNYTAAVADFTIAHNKLSALEKEQKNDPILLYQLAWTNYLGYGSATRLENEQVIADFLDRATAYTERLKAVEEQDASIYRLSLQMREAKSQLLASQGNFDDALLMQQGVVNDLSDSVEKGNLSANTFSLAFSHIILAYLHKDMNNRPSTCKSLTIAEQLLRPLAEQNSLPEYMLNASKRLPARIVDCESGLAIKSLNALFD